MSNESLRVLIKESNQKFSRKIKDLNRSDIDYLEERFRRSHEWYSTRQKEWDSRVKSNYQILQKYKKTSAFKQQMKEKDQELASKKVEQKRKYEEQKAKIAKEYPHLIAKVAEEIIAVSSFPIFIRTHSGEKFEALFFQNSYLQNFTREKNNSLNTWIYWENLIDSSNYKKNVEIELTTGLKLYIRVSSIDGFTTKPEVADDAMNRLNNNIQILKSWGIPYTTYEKDISDYQNGLSEEKLNELENALWQG